MKKDIKLGKGLAMLAGSALAITAINANATANLFEAEELGSAGELRNQLLGTDYTQGFVSNSEVELKCGEGKCGEGKCGESKDGEKASEKKAEKKEEKKSEGKAEEKKESKSGEHKCGEGKCGEGKCGTH